MKKKIWLSVFVSLSKLGGRVAQLDDSVKTLKTDVADLQTSVTTVIIPGIASLEKQIADLKALSPSDPNLPASIDTLDGTVKNIKQSILDALTPPVDNPPPNPAP